MADVRLHLTDREIARLPAPASGWYLARDTELKGFFVVVGRRKKTFTVQGDLRLGTKRQTIRVAVGEAGDISTREARGVGKGFLAQIAKGVHPRPPASNAHAAPKPTSNMGPTLRSAWERYRDGHMVRKERSDRTIAGYRDHVERILVAWSETPLVELGDNPERVAAEHDRITVEHGPYIANGTMRTLRAIYNHARKTDRKLPADNPVNAIDWNGEKRRDSGLGLADLQEWFGQVARLDNPVRREFHLFTLLSGSRPTALKQVRVEHVDWQRRMLHIPSPKGGTKKAFDIPLSREMILCLVRARRFGRQMYPEQSTTWVFPAASAEGHLVEQKEDRSTLAKWGNDLRQSYRTLAQTAGVSDFDARLLMNHALPGVNAGYITRHKLLEDHLRAQQQAISKAIMLPTRGKLDRVPKLAAWFAPGAGRLNPLHCGGYERHT